MCCGRNPCKRHVHEEGVSQASCARTCGQRDHGVLQQTLFCDGVLVAPLRHVHWIDPGICRGREGRCWYRWWVVFQRTEGLVPSRLCSELHLTALRATPRPFPSLPYHPYLPGTCRSWVCHPHLFHRRQRLSTTFTHTFTHTQRRPSKKQGAFHTHTLSLVPPHTPPLSLLVSFRALV